MSPAPDRREPAIGNISPKKSSRSFYQLPNAAVSEPLLPSKSFETVHAVGKQHQPSPLVPPASRPTLNGRDSSSEWSSLADVGAAMAMSSRSSSAASLPVLTAESLDLAKNSPRRRQVRLKTTMRKESRPEREKGYVHTGRSVNDRSRKETI